MIFVAVILILVLLMAGCGPTKRCIVSPLSGTIVAHGAPVSGAKVTRKYYSHWYKDRVETVVLTDTNGYFEFKGAWKTAVVNILHQPVVEEEVDIEFRGTNYSVLKVSKMDYENFGEMSNGGIGHKRLGKLDGKLFLQFDVDTDSVPKEKDE